MTNVDNLAIALHVMLPDLMSGEYFAIGRFGREVEFLSDADAFPRRVLDYAGALNLTALAVQVMPVPEPAELMSESGIDRKNRSALASGLAWLGDGETLIVYRSGSDRGPTATFHLVHVDGRSKSAGVSTIAVESIAAALHELRPE